MARCLYRVIKSCTHARVNWAKASAYRPALITGEHREGRVGTRARR